MKFNIKKAFPILGLAMTLGMSSCVNDLDVKPIDPRLNTQVDASKLFNKMYAEFVFEGKGPASRSLTSATLVCRCCTVCCGMPTS